MAFYPDELSPIEKLRSSGKSPELADLNVLSINRRQWKSQVLGKKDLGFATITEEKEEDISSDGSSGIIKEQKKSGSCTNVHSKKITFPKPMKYITTKVTEGKVEEPVKAQDSPKPPAKDSICDKKINNLDDLSSIVNSPKMNLPEVRQLIRGKMFAGEQNFQPQEVLTNHAFNDMKMNKQLKDSTMSPALLTGWPKKDNNNNKIKGEKKRVTEEGEKEVKKKKVSKPSNKKVSPKKTQENKPIADKPQTNSGNKSTSLNMKDVVNVYKNLTYGTKDEIKSFVANLSFVKDDEKSESDKNLLSMMNLKALETKLKNLEKKPGQNGTTKKRSKTGRKTRKSHNENLTRNKVVKVPATLDYKYSPDSKSLTYGTSGSITEQKRKSTEEKIPWKYVGTQSVLDKTYLVYPSYPQYDNKKRMKKVNSENKKKKKETNEEVVKEKPPQTKVKQSKETMIRDIPRVRSEGSNGFALSPNRYSAMTVCTIEFRPESEQKCPETQPSDQSFLVYLHGAKATFVKSPYSDKQFSRVRFLRKYGNRSPLIKGVTVGDGNRSVRPPTDKSDGHRLYDCLNFEDDIQNINAFLLSQNQDSSVRPEKEPRSSHNMRGSSRRKEADKDILIEEISRDLDSLRYLPDTKENRQIIGDFFDELDRRIERSKTKQFLDDNKNNNNNQKNNHNSLVPIVGY